MSMDAMSRCYDVQVSGLAKSVLMAIADSTGFEFIMHDFQPAKFVRTLCWTEEQIREGVEELLAKGILVPYVDKDRPHLTGFRVLGDTAPAV